MQVKGPMKVNGPTKVNIKRKFFSYAWMAVNIILEYLYKFAFIDL